MTTTAPKQRSETAEQILDLAETLIQTRGYSAFSYQDISDALGIRKASIHYHFASKTDLGIAVVDRYVERFGAALVAIADDQSQSSMAMLDFYIEALSAIRQHARPGLPVRRAGRRNTGAAAGTARARRSFLQGASDLADRDSQARGRARRVQACRRRRARWRASFSGPCRARCWSSAPPAIHRNCKTSSRS